jgi:SAM-dependent methyltransferase
MTTEYLAARWGAVDEATDPGAFVRYLDTVAALERMQCMKRRTYDLLQVEKGQHLLDVGCGLGPDVQALAQRVGNAGRVVGIDSSATMIAEAQRRAAGLGLPVAFARGDAGHLAFAADSFDGCRSERLLVHLDHPPQALAEMARVVRPRGRIVVLDADWDTLVVDVPDLRTTRRLVNFLCGQSGSRWIGRRLRGLFLEAGLTEVEVVADALMVTDLMLANQVLALHETAAHAVALGIVSAAEADVWLDDSRQAHAAGRFFAAVTFFCVSGRTS